MSAGAILPSAGGKAMPRGGAGMRATVTREVSARQARKRRRTVRNGEPTNDLVFSAHAGGNETIFPQILSLYVPRSSIVADITYGEGVFWRNVPDDWYVLLGTDIQTGTDCRDLPYGDGEIDCVVLDPPYMHTPGGTAHTFAHDDQRRRARRGRSWCSVRGRCGGCASAIAPRRRSRRAAPSGGGQRGCGRRPPPRTCRRR